MKKFSVLMVLVFFCFSLAKAQQKYQLIKIWQTDTVVAVPESVLIDYDKKLLYVSEIGLGNSSSADGNGEIALLGLDGKIIDLHFAKGMDSPKGLGKYGNNLYVADLTKVFVIDTKTGSTIRTFPVEGAGMLNDVSVNAKGVAYISDSRTKKIHKIKNNQLTTFMEGIDGINGLKAIGTDLYVLGGKRFFKVDKNLRKTEIATLPQGGDGLEPIGNGDFLVTSWGGYIFYVYKNGNVETLLDSHNPRVNTADLDYDAKKKILYVPSFFNKTVTAYRLEEVK
ncbi:outer membrane protein assembly factor BamB [Pedobacter sp. UYEF25]